MGQHNPLNENQHNHRTIHSDQRIERFILTIHREVRSTWYQVASNTGLDVQKNIKNIQSEHRGLNHTKSESKQEKFYKIAESSFLMFLKGRLFGHDCKMLIYTGASLSCINHDFWDMVKPMHYPIKLTPYQEVATFSGNEIQVHRK